MKFGDKSDGVESVGALLKKLLLGTKARSNGLISMDSERDVLTFNNADDGTPIRLRILCSRSTIWLKFLKSSLKSRRFIASGDGAAWAQGKRASTPAKSKGW
jgi:hypothetical protein